MMMLSTTMQSDKWIMSRRQMLKAVAAATGCALAPGIIAFEGEPWKLSKEDEAFLDDLERQGCLFFWEQASATKTGQILDRARNDLIRRA
jgi:hypothetical protein